MSSLDQTFREEADELLIDLEAAMLELEEHPDDADCVNRAFRAMHTIKGSGAMFGFDKLAAFTHHLENAFDRVRSGELEISKQLITISLDSSDHIRALLADKEPGPELERHSAVLLARLHVLSPSVEREAAQKTAPKAKTGAEKFESRDTTYRLRIRPTIDTLRNGMDPLPVLRELRALGPCHVTTLTGEVPLLTDLDAESCLLAWDLILTTDQGRNAIDDVFIFVQDDWTISVEILDGSGHWSDIPEDRPIGEILVDRGDASIEQVQVAQGKQKRIGEILSESANIQPEKIRSALREQQVIRASQRQREEHASASSVKVAAAKLDVLMDLVGELVIAQARLNRTASDLQDPVLSSVAEDMERLTTELRDNTLELRMLPIGTTFARFRRLVRDLSNELGKQIDLVTEGAETELDKTVIDRLGDPLVHLIRNSIDHGIETPERRVAAGKPAKGVVKLSAVHSEASVMIRIEDDGAGLDAQAIRTRAIERGLLAEDAMPADQELYNLVFEAGFSTAKTVSGVSGRGVGMDVVRRFIESMRGKVSIDSSPGKGSTVIVELPLTLAIIEGLLVQVEDEHFVMPLSLVEECIELSSEDLAQANGNRLIEVRGELVPYLRLRESFGQQGRLPQIEQIVVTRLGDTRFGFGVDRVIGQHQTVIKKLGKMYEGVTGLAGATILGDGAVALILDAHKLMQTAVAESCRIH